MKALLLIGALVLSLNTLAQNVNIPDANFKAFLIGEPTINTNLDLEIQVSEAVAFGGTIDCQSLSISDLTGIEAFTTLTELNCSYNQLTSLNVSSNSTLTSLECADNQLTSLDVSQNIGLTFLGCWSNELTSLDVSQNIELINLDSPFNQFICLNVKNGNNTNFLYFDVRYNSNLTCIEVDDAVWSTANWTFIDTQTTFSTSCENPCTLGIEELSNPPKKLIKIVDLIGRETEHKPNTALIYVYSDGTTDKVFKVEL